MDGSFVAQVGGAGAGIVALLHRCSDAAEAEASACMIGLRLATQWAPGRVVLEMDCAQARDYARMLEELKVVQVKRECNLVADELAKLARNSNKSVLWLDDAPACVTHLLENDCTMVS
ncbi:hypothetical protein HU200_033788 [Digitaria exilis]|uniref:RNase H type-1 domain-containing protein n=1 Tax=Digitaria exilis TaxID=1010633 RepID=A0A835EMP7_9POAL|nr:hypothetical protein HU200_033788 [Digitaria exilis]